MSAFWSERVFGPFDIFRRFIVNASRTQLVGVWRVLPNNRLKFTAKGSSTSIVFRVYGWGMKTVRLVRGGTSITGRFA